jgi:type IV pilus assembly protein PilA
MNRREGGFTLIEIMIVVAIIGVLAIVVVPGFFRESSKAKHKTEVTAMFAELTVKLEQYKMESSTGQYLAAAACPSTGPNKTGYDFVTTCATTGSGWANLRVAPPNNKMFCSYAVSVGNSATTPSPPSGFTMTSPATAWWFAVATCDMDASGGTNATFFVNSIDTKIQSQNVGK